MTYVGRSPHEAFFTPGRHGGLGHGARRGLRRRARRHDLRGEARGSRCRTDRACRSSRPTAGTATSAPPSLRRPSSSPSPIIGSSGASSRRARSAPTSPPPRTARRSGSRSRTSARPRCSTPGRPSRVLKTLDTGPITNHVNFARNANGTFAYVTVGGLNEVKVFRTDDFTQVATIPVGKLPARRLAIGRRHAGSTSGWRTPTRSPRSTRSPTRSSPTIPIGQAPQAVAYVPNAVPTAMAREGLQPLGVAGPVAHLALVPPGPEREARTAHRHRPASRCSIRG